MNPEREAAMREAVAFAMALNAHNGSHQSALTMWTEFLAQADAAIAAARPFIEEALIEQFLDEAKPVPGELLTPVVERFIKVALRIQRDKNAQR